MSCALALIAAFALTPAEAAEIGYTAPVPAASTQVATATPQPLTAEPLFADIVGRADALSARATGWMSTGQIADPAGFRSDVARLAELDMQAHRTLAERGTDPDLKCMLRGMSQDLTRQVTAIDAAGDDAARRTALQRLGTLLEENAAVIRAPARPPV